MSIYASGCRMDLTKLDSTFVALFDQMEAGEISNLSKALSEERAQIRRKSRRVVAYEYPREFKPEVSEAAPPPKPRPPRLHPEDRDKSGRRIMSPAERARRRARASAWKRPSGRFV